MDEVVGAWGPVSLRQTRDADLDFCLEAERDPVAAPWVDRWERNRHLMAMVDPDQSHWIIQDAQSDRRLGFMTLEGLADPNDCLEVTRLVIARRGRGWGRAALRALKETAFGRLKAHRLWLVVTEENARARGLFRSEGFQEEGLMREALRRDDFWANQVVMALLAGETSTGR